MSKFKQQVELFVNSTGGLGFEPASPLLVAAVDNLRAIPKQLRSNVVCFRGEYEDETGQKLLAVYRFAFDHVFKRSNYAGLFILKMTLQATSHAFLAGVEWACAVSCNASLPRERIEISVYWITTSIASFWCEALFHNSDDVFLTAINLLSHYDLGE